MKSPCPGAWVFGSMGVKRHHSSIEENPSDPPAKRARHTYEQEKVSGKTWTLEEDTRLLEQLGRGIPICNVVLPNRSKHSVKRRVETFRERAKGLAGSLNEQIAQALAKTKARWTALEDASLLHQSMHGTPPSKIVIPNRTTNAVKLRLARLRKQARALDDKEQLSDDVPQAPAETNVKWKSAEVSSLLHQSRQGVPLSKIVIPNRTTHSIQMRLARLLKEARVDEEQKSDKPSQAPAKGAAPHAPSARASASFRRRYTG